MKVSKSIPKSERLLIVKPFLPFFPPVLPYNRSIKINKSIPKPEHLKLIKPLISSILPLNPYQITTFWCCR